jgi:hypothetical protein
MITLAGLLMRLNLGIGIRLLCREGQTRPHTEHDWLLPWKWVAAASASEK